MRLQVLFETTEEDRALISLSSAIYDKVISHTELDQPINLGKVGDIVDTPLHALNDVSIELRSGDDFLKRIDADPVSNIGKDVFAAYDDDTNSVILNFDHLDKHRSKTAITHELRHALDNIKSETKFIDNKRYFTPKKKEHRKDDPYSTLKYRAQPAEINARFTELLDILSKRIPKWYDKLDASEIKPQLTTDFNNLLNKYEIADIFPEKTKSPDYKRLVKRAYDFMQKEMTHIESELAKKGTPKKATGSF